MKKYLLLFVLGTALVTGAAAQNGNGRGKQKAKHENKGQKSQKDKDDDGTVNNGRRNDDDMDEQGKKNKGEKKYAKNAPAKVKAAFDRDFPNATNVSWTKNRNVWTAHFNGSIFGTNTASYSANGVRVNSNNTVTTQSIFGNR